MGCTERARGLRVELQRSAPLGVAGAVLLAPEGHASASRSSTKKIPASAVLAVQGGILIHALRGVCRLVARRAGNAKPVSYKGKTKGGPRMLEPPLGW